MKKFGFKKWIVLVVLLPACFAVSPAWGAPPGQASGSGIADYDGASAGPLTSPAVAGEVESIVYLHGSGGQVVAVLKGPDNTLTASSKSKSGITLIQRVRPPDLSKIAGRGQKENNCNLCHKLSLQAKGIKASRSVILRC